MGKLKNRRSKHNYAILCLWLMQKILCLWYPMTYSWYQWYQWYLFNLHRKNLPLHQVLDHRSSSYVGDLAAVVHKTQRQRVQTLRFVADNVRNSTFCWRGVDGTLFGRFFCWVSLLKKDAPKYGMFGMFGGGNGLFADWKIYRWKIPAMRISELWIRCELRFCTPVHHNSFTFYMKLREKRLLMLLDLASESMFASVFLLGEESWRDVRVLWGQHLGVAEAVIHEVCFTQCARLLLAFSFTFKKESWKVPVSEKKTGDLRLEFSHDPVVKDWVVLGQLHVQRWDSGILQQPLGSKIWQIKNGIYWFTCKQGRCLEL